MHLYAHLRGRCSYWAGQTLLRRTAHTDAHAVAEAKGSLVAQADADAIARDNALREHELRTGGPRLHGLAVGFGLSLPPQSTLLMLCDQLIGRAF